MEQQNKADKPFFVWWNSTRMHVWTHLKKESQGKTGLGLYPDGMVEHDAQVGELLKKLDELGIADNTIVMYSTDNGAETFTWPDGGTTPFRGEKATNWEGGYRVPTLIRWPGTIKPGSVYNDVFAHEDLMPTLLAAAGEPDVKEKLLKGTRPAARPSRCTSTATTWCRSSRARRKRRRARSSSTGTTTASWWHSATRTGSRLLRAAQPWHRRVGGTVRRPARAEALQPTRRPVRAGEHESIGYSTWRVDRAFVLVPAQAFVAHWLATFKEFPPRQKPASFNLDEVMPKLTERLGSTR